MSIRRMKKILKGRDNNFFSLLLKGNVVFCVNESDELVFHRNGISVAEKHFHNEYGYVPYTRIKQFIKE